jgi:hypothetical protein
MEAQIAARGANRYDLSHLSDSALLAGTRRLVGTSNQLFADLLAHLAEVEARRIHRTRACASLYTYCIYELRFSEDAAFRRVSAARLVKSFPALFDAVAAGELHLTGLLMLGPHLTQANQAEVLARAKHRTKRELAQLVRELAPLPNVPARIEPLGPPERGLVPPRNPTWEQFTRALNPVRELAPGERPRDWIDERALLPTVGEVSDEAALPDAANEAEALVGRSSQAGPAPARVKIMEAAVETHPALARNDLTLRGPVRGPQRYSVQFTATEDYVKLVERAKALLSHASMGASLEELHLRAMQALVSELEKRKYAITKRAANSDAEPLSGSGSGSGSDSAFHSDSVSDSVSDSGSVSNAVSDADSDESPRGRGRYVPARVRREVFRRDEGRCTYVDVRGQQCRETSLLELHHLHAYALGGTHSPENLTLRCRAHNALAAEQDFGCAGVARQRDSSRHESLRRQQPP